MSRHSSKSDPVSEGAPSSASRRRNLSPLRRLFPFLWPYRLQILGAMLALTVAAGTVLGLGQGMRVLVDQGFVAGDSALLDRALLVLLVVIVLMAASTFGRFYLVSWIGERVVADIRRAVYSHVVKLSPGFFETTKTGEILTRLTTDTEVLQTVVGSSVSIALRNTLMFVGGTAMLLVTSPKLGGAGVPGRAGGHPADHHPGAAGARPVAGQPGQDRRPRLLRGGDAGRHPHDAGLHA
ncbi:ABC transporter transmembrane domain-containing protein [Azospirillum baldaniorum]|uniref:ABC transmembrane type-1 domain-containing protein n=1 Tax=Azospirillum baldaniorum TaxID=1064539 RepID=A0A9P1JS98_9PROT|nr:protein of unknown function [Azospirillum baldaniorum]